MKDKDRRKGTSRAKQGDENNSHNVPPLQPQQSSSTQSFWFPASQHPTHHGFMAPYPSPPFIYGNIPQAHQTMVTYNLNH